MKLEQPADALGLGLGFCPEDRKESGIVAELTVRDGKVVWDLNGMTRDDWDKLPARYGTQGDPRWDAYAPRGRGTSER